MPSGNNSVLISGGTGFVGKRLVKVLAASGRPVSLLARRPVAAPDVPYGVQTHVVPEGADARALASAVKGVQTVCHLAGRAHMLGAPPGDEAQLFEEANVALSCRLAEAAFNAGAGRFVFVSSIGAVANSSAANHPLSEQSPCRPISAYGRSKLRAEQLLREIATRHGAELVVVRPPLVHGKGAPGNLARMTRWVAAGLPLPFAGMKNKRSLIHVDNLASVLMQCVDDPRARGQTFHVRDARDYSTTEILEGVARSCGRTPRLFSMPRSLLAAAMTLAGQQAAFEQLTGWLQVDDHHVRSTLGFTPVVLPFETA